MTSANWSRPTGVPEAKIKSTPVFKLLHESLVFGSPVVDRLASYARILRAVDDGATNALSKATLSRESSLRSTSKTGKVRRVMRGARRDAVTIALWRKFSKWYLAQNPLCRACEKKPPPVLWGLPRPITSFLCRMAEPSTMTTTCNRYAGTAISGKRIERQVFVSEQRTYLPRRGEGWVESLQGSFRRPERSAAFTFPGKSVRLSA